jgi:hypothetical protein
MNHCKHYLPWVVVAGAFRQEEINDACVNDKRRTICACPRQFQNNPETCPNYEPKD